MAARMARLNPFAGGGGLRYCRAMSSASHPPAAAGFPDVLVARALEAALAGADGGRTPVFAVAGLQGSGKSTFAAQLVARAVAGGLRAAALSIDDFYLPRAQRARLAADVHPLLATRGPPGTHDVALATEVLDAVRDGHPTALPRFDKLADDRLEPARWTRVERPLDLLVFEGWFLKTPPQDEAALAAPVNALERERDAEGRWRRHCNAALGRDYPALWRRLDRLWFLRGPGFEVVTGWRWQQERELVASHAGTAGRSGMDRDAVARFVQLFERVSRQALTTLPGIAERTIPLDAARKPLRAEDGAAAA